MAGAKPTPTRARILVVDDHKAFTEMVELWLRPQYEVAIARDGQSGLELAAQLQPDLLLVDIMMPRMSGLEMLEAIGTRRELASIPVVIMSAYAEMQDPLLIAALRPWIVLQKPFAQRDLMDCIEAILGRPGQAPEPASESERQALVSALIAELERDGLEVVQASGGDYRRPPRVRGCAPDVVAYHRGSDLIHFGIVETDAGLEAPAVRLRIRKLSEQIMGDGSHSGSLIPLSIMVPRGSGIKALQLLKDMGLMSRHMHEIFIIQDDAE